MQKHLTPGYAPQRLIIIMNSSAAKKPG